MIGWHHRLNGHAFEQAPGDSEGQGRLACCIPWGCKVLDMTEPLNNTRSKPQPAKCQCILGKSEFKDSLVCYECSAETIGDINQNDFSGWMDRKTKVLQWTASDRGFLGKRWALKRLCSAGKERRYLVIQWDMKLRQSFLGITLCLTFSLLPSLLYHVRQKGHLEICIMWYKSSWAWEKGKLRKWGLWGIWKVNSEVRREDELVFLWAALFISAS